MSQWYRGPSEERDVALLKALYRYSEMRITVESVTKTFAQSGNGITTTFHSTRILTEDIPVRDKIFAKAEGHLEIRLRAEGSVTDLALLPGCQCLSQRSLLQRVRVSGWRGDSLIRAARGILNDCHLGGSCRSALSASLVRRYLSSRS